MQLHINGSPREVALRSATRVTLDRLLEALDVPCERGVAVAVNDEVIPRSMWHEAPIREGDRVEIIRATQGG